MNRTERLHDSTTFQPEILEQIVDSCDLCFISIPQHSSVQLYHTYSLNQVANFLAVMAIALYTAGSMLNQDAAYSYQRFLSL